MRTASEARLRCTAPEQQLRRATAATTDTMVSAISGPEGLSSTISGTCVESGREVQDVGSARHLSGDLRELVTFSARERGKESGVEVRQAHGKEAWTTKTPVQ